MKKIFSILLIFNTLISFSQKKEVISYEPNKTYSPAELKEDAVFLRKCLEEAHPSLYRYTSKDSLDLAFDNFEKSIMTPMTDKQFRAAFFPVVNQIRCGHSSLLPSKARQQYYTKNKNKFLPFISIIIDNQLFVTENKSNDSSLIRGTEILSIDGKPVAECIKAPYESVSKDGYNTTHEEATMRFNFSNLYYYRLFEERDTFLLKVKNQNGDIKNLKVACVEAFSLSATATKTITQNKPIFSLKTANYLKIDEQNPSLAVMKLDGFPTMKFWKFYRKSFKYLRKNKIENLVLDLRDNGGGLIFNAGHLLSYLIQTPVDFEMENRGKKPSFVTKKVGEKEYKMTRNLLPLLPKKSGVSTTKNDTFYQISYKNKPKKKNAYKGNLYVLTNGQTFSASVIVASYLKKEQRAVFIGEETGGAEEGSNAFNMPFVPLPNTQLLYRLPLYRLNHKGVNTTQKGRGVMPDFPIQYSLKERMKNEDLEMEKVRNLIKSKGAK